MVTLDRALDGSMVGSRLICCRAQQVGGWGCLSRGSSAVGCSGRGSMRARGGARARSAWVRLCGAAGSAIWELQQYTTLHDWPTTVNYWQTPPLPLQTNAQQSHTTHYTQPYTSPPRNPERTGVALSYAPPVMSGGVRAIRVCVPGPMYRVVLGCGSRWVSCTLVMCGTLGGIRSSSPPLGS